MQIPTSCPSCLFRGNDWQTVQEVKVKSCTLVRTGGGWRVWFSAGQRFVVLMEHDWNVGGFAMQKIPQGGGACKTSWWTRSNIIVVLLPKWDDQGLKLAMGQFLLTGPLSSRAQKGTGMCTSCVWTRHGQFKKGHGNILLMSEILVQYCMPAFYLATTWW